MLGQPRSDNAMTKIAFIKELEPFVKAMYRMLEPFVKVLTYQVMSSSIPL